MRDVSRRALVYVATAFLAPCVSVQAQGLTEAEAVSRALAVSPRVRAASTLPAQAEAEYRVRRALPNPAVRFQQEDAAGSRDRFFTVDQELPVSGRRGLLADASTRAVAAATALARSEADLVRRDARIAYAELQAASARLRLLTDGLAALDAVIERLRAREAAGEGSTFDRLRVERERVDFADDERATRGAIAVAQAQLASLIGVAEGGAHLVATDTLDAATPVAPLADALQHARTRRPALQAAAADVERLRLEQRAAGRLARPQPIVSAGWKQTDEGSRSDSGYVFALGVAVPLFSRGAAEVAVSSSALAAAEARQESLARDIDTEVRSAYASVESGRERTRRYEADALAPSRELVRIATLAYEEGELGILELLDAHRTRLAAELQAIELKREARLAAVVLDFVTADEVIR